MKEREKIENGLFENCFDICCGYGTKPNLEEGPDVAEFYAEYRIDNQKDLGMCFNEFKEIFKEGEYELKGKFIEEGYDNM